MHAQLIPLTLLKRLFYFLWFSVKHGSKNAASTLSGCLGTSPLCVFMQGEITNRDPLGHWEDQCKVHIQYIHHPVIKEIVSWSQNQHPSTLSLTFDDPDLGSGRHSTSPATHSLHYRRVWWNITLDFLALRASDQTSVLNRHTPECLRLILI